MEGYSGGRKFRNKFLVVVMFEGLVVVDRVSWEEDSVRSYII